MWLGRLLAHSMRRWHLLAHYSHTVPPCESHSTRLFFGSTLETAFDDVSFFPFRPWDAKDKVILGCISRPFGLSILVLGNYSPRPGPWALMESGPGPQILWPHKLYYLWCHWFDHRLDLGLTKKPVTSPFSNSFTILVYKTMEKTQKEKKKKTWTKIWKINK